MMGGAGLTQATRVAILSANYIAQRLAGAYDVLYTGRDGRVAHECIIDTRALNASAGVTVDDISKRLIDCGFHPPTMSWPVPGTLMIEPTESETKGELDRFCDAMLAIREEARAIEQGLSHRSNNPLKNAPPHRRGPYRRVAPAIFQGARVFPGGSVPRRQILAPGEPGRQCLRRPQPRVLVFTARLLCQSPRAGGSGRADFRDVTATGESLVYSIQRNGSQMNAPYSVLIADPIHADGRALLAAEAGLRVDVESGLDEAALTARIPDYDALIVRSKTRVTRPVIAAATRLKAIGRAGIGVDNIDVAAATERGIVVFNTPDANATTTAELTLAHLLSLSRHLPQADRSVRQGEWQPARFSRCGACRKDHRHYRLRNDRTLGVPALCGA